MVELARDRRRDIQTFFFLQIFPKRCRKVWLDFIFIFFLWSLGLCVVESFMIDCGTSGFHLFIFVKRVYWEKCLASGRMCKSIFHSYFCLSFLFQAFLSRRNKKFFQWENCGISRIIFSSFAASMKLSFTHMKLCMATSVNCSIINKMTLTIWIIEHLHSSRSEFFMWRPFFLDENFEQFFTPQFLTFTFTFYSFFCSVFFIFGTNDFKHVYAFNWWGDFVQFFN